MSKGLQKNCGKKGFNSREAKNFHLKWWQQKCMYVAPNLDIVGGERQCNSTSAINLCKIFIAHKMRQ